MRVKKVNRYYCDFCKKANCHAGHMRHHEERCTMNPNRKCGVCQMMQMVQKPMSELLAILPSPYWTKDKYGASTFGPLEELKKAMEVLREATENCPACILATFRQKAVETFLVDFDFKSEMAETWTQFNADQHKCSY